MQQLSALANAENGPKSGQPLPHRASDDATDTSSCPDGNNILLPEDLKILNLLPSPPPTIVRPMSMCFMEPSGTITIAENVASGNATPVNIVQPPALLRAKSQTNMKRITMNDYALLSLLGSGAFSKVALVEQISTKKRFAMKVMEKSFLERVIQHRQVNRKIWPHMLSVKGRYGVSSHMLA